MARFSACQSLCQNLSSIGKDELTSTTLTEDIDTSTPTSAILYILIPAFGVISFSNNELFKPFMKAYLKAQISA